MKNPINPWKTISSKELYADRFSRFRADAVIRPDNQKGTYSVLETRPAVAISAVTPDGRIALTGEWRYPQKTFMWGVPAGLSDEGESPLACAKRELLEEAFITSPKWVNLGLIAPASGRMSTVVHIFLAKNAKVQRFKPAVDEIQKRRLVPVSTAVHMCNDGRIFCGVSMLAIYKAACYLGILK